MKFTVIKKEGTARRGVFETVHGTVQTPAFMNVATCGAIKGASNASATMMPSRIAAPRVVGLLRRRRRTVERSEVSAKSGTVVLMRIRS